MHANLPTSSHSRLYNGYGLGWGKIVNDGNGNRNRNGISLML